jgi:L-fucose isomerase-like protein
MKTNIHPYERVARVVIGLAAASLAFVGPANKWFLIGLVPVATGLLGWCPPYHLLGISTCPKK